MATLHKSCFSSGDIDERVSEKSRAACICESEKIMKESYPAMENEDLDRDTAAALRRGNPIGVESALLLIALLWRAL